MTRAQRDALGLSWPLVAIVALTFGFVFGVFAISDPQGRTALLGVLLATMTSIITIAVQRLSSRVDRTRREMTGDTYDQL